jgi:hypothetical protein
VQGLRLKVRTIKVTEEQHQDDLRTLDNDGEANHAWSGPLWQFGGLHFKLDRLRG